MVLITYTPFYLIEEFNSVCLSILLARAHPLVRRFSTQGCCGALAVAEHHNNKDYISYYLAGLLEGDGHFNTPKKLCTPSRRRDLFRDASLPPTFMPQGPGVVRESPSAGPGKGFSEKVIFYLLFPPYFRWPGLPVKLGARRSEKFALRALIYFLSMLSYVQYPINLQV